MKSVTFLIIAMLYYDLTYSQPLTNFSKTFPSDQKNVPLNIIPLNNNIYVLRYNKSIHDFIVEKRVKGTGQILFFKRLKLDSVCADWFNYENLDYLFFESNHKLILVFEKDTKTQKQIFIKTIDTSGHVSGFKELAAIEWNSNIMSDHFKFKRTAGNNLFILGTVVYLNGLVQKTALLYDVNSSANIWLKKLPDENYNTAGTNLFEVNKNNDLYFTRYNVVRLTDTTGRSVIYDTLALCKLSAGSKRVVSRAFILPPNYGLHDAFLLPVNDDVVFFASAFENRPVGNNKYCNGYFVCQKFSGDLSVMYYDKISLYDESTQKKLTYFDGSYYQDPGFKPFGFSDHFADGNDLIAIMEVHDREFYKNILSLKFDLEKGEMKWMHVVTRKIFFFPHRIVYHNIGCYKASYVDSTLSIYFLESSNNLKLDINTATYNDYEKQTNYWGSNTVRVKIGKNGELSKELFFRDKTFDLIPLKNSQLLPDVPAVFFITNSRNEKFGFE